MDANAFDFFGVAPGGGFDGFGAGIAKDAEGNGGVSALLFIALEAEGHVVLTQAFPGDFEALMVLFHFQENGGGSGAFYEVIGIGLGGIGGVEELEELAGSDGGSGRSETARAGAGEAFSIMGEVFSGDNFLFFIEPAQVAFLTPVSHVLFGDGFGGEFGGEDFFDDREFIEPREDLGVAVAIEDTLVDLFAEVAGETGDLAGEGVVGGGFGFGDGVNDGWGGDGHINYEG
jgi:hypothetical protein